MRDVEIAHSKLIQENLGLIFVKEGRILFSDKSHGLTGFLDAIRRLGSQLEKSSMADKVFGKASALLAIYVDISEVYADIASREAIRVINKNRIPHKYSKLVSTILNRSRTDMCPFERAVKDTDDPAEAFRRLKSILHS